MKNKSLAAILRRGRLKSGLTLREVEGLCPHVSNAHMSKLENGRERLPHPIRLRELAHIFKLDIVELHLSAGYITQHELTKHIRGRS